MRVLWVFCWVGIVSLEIQNEQHREHLLPKCVTCLLALPGTGPTSNFYSPGLESTPQLCNENRVLREENQRLQAQLSHASRGGWSKAANCGYSLSSLPVNTSGCESFLAPESERKWLGAQLQGEQGQAATPTPLPLIGSKRASEAPEGLGLLTGEEAWPSPQGLAVGTAADKASRHPPSQTPPPDLKGPGPDTISPTLGVLPWVPGSAPEPHKGHPGDKQGPLQHCLPP